MNGKMCEHDRGPIVMEGSQLVSVSRRTDIPAFYAEWFRHRLERGFADYRHPFTQQMHRVRLDRDHVAGFIFWSKNFAPFLDVIGTISQMGYPFYCQYTITGYGKRLEPHLPDLEERLSTFRDVSMRSSAGQVILRYDPIIFSPTFDETYHLERLEMVLSLLENKGRRCVISFVHIYKKIRSRLESLGLDTDPPVQRKVDLSLAMKELCLDYGFELCACCCPELTMFGIPAAACISAAYLSRIAPHFDFTPIQSPTRSGCNCDRCQDIGAYDTCLHGCIYCYANSNRKAVEARSRSHQVHGNPLV